MNRRVGQIRNVRRARARALALILAMALLTGCRGVPVDATQFPPATVQPGEAASRAASTAGPAGSLQTASPTGSAQPATTPSQMAGSPPESAALEAPSAYTVQEYPLPAGSRPHDVAP